MIQQLLFFIILAAASYFFYKNMVKVRRNILLGKDIDLSGNSTERWRTMALVAIGQGKMFTRPLAAVMHLFVYAGFILINMEVLEILIDGLFGTHRVFAQPLGIIYDAAMAFFEVLAFLVIVACVVFLFRRYIVKVKRFSGFEMRAFPVQDAATILFVEIILMSCLLLLNAVDKNLQNLNAEHYIQVGMFPISSVLVPMFSNMSVESLHMIERVAWWGHIIGILIFMNYLPYSKHFHIIMAFPNTYYSNLNAKGKLNNMDSVTTEVKLMMDPSAQPPEGYEPPTSFGVKDVTDLTWKNLMDAYTCTECGRCTSVCPANITGKLLSPRKIMMDTRDRLEEVGKNIDQNKTFVDDSKNLHSYISEQELWACTTCQACVQICPVNINPMEIIVEMRRFKVMEQSSAPQELNGMFTNIENNGAPWQMAQSARFDWSQE
ncbi:MAG: (Fe-S)-binding protein [Bacteroidetes bacterium]|nr:(Fe-S)-binding protein [Bacteroidota bacterium]